MLMQIRNADFLIAWTEDKLKRPKPAKPLLPRPRGGGGGGGGGGSGGSGGGGGGKPHAPSGKPILPAVPADPSTILGYKDKYGNINVNPYLVIDLDLNKSKLICERCGSIHKWLTELCTSFKNKLGEIIEPKLSHGENLQRSLTRYNLGFFASKDPNVRPPPRESPTVQEGAASATATNRRLGN